MAARPCVQCCGAQCCALTNVKGKAGAPLVLPSEHTLATTPAAVVLYSLARFCHSPPASTNLAAAVLCYAHPAESTAALSTVRPIS